VRISGDGEPTMSEREPIPVGSLVTLRFATAEWEVLSIEDGKEGADTVYVLRPTRGTERTIRVGYGAIRPESVRRPD
jgi:hypothetical protein